MHARLASEFSRQRSGRVLAATISTWLLGAAGCDSSSPPNGTASPFQDEGIETKDAGPIGCPDASGIVLASNDAGGARDAGSCGASTQPSGCFTMAEFDDCNSRCKGFDVPVIGMPLKPDRQCTRACACGFGTENLVEGCTTDSDCVFVRADCCGCAEGGQSAAVLRTNAKDWEAEISARCPPNGWGPDGCEDVSYCGAKKAVCNRGRCTATTSPDTGQ